MGIVFDDDKPVECNCGHTVERGWVSEETITIMYRGKPKTVIYTYCNNDGCECVAMRDALERYVDREEYCIRSAYDKECERADDCD